MTALIPLSREKIAHYQAAALRRRENEAKEIESLVEQAWVAAKYAARSLREQFNVSRVVVFGSLVHQGSFTRWSDVDIAAWGISAEDTFRAIGAVMDLDTPFDVNLVDVNACRPGLLNIIEQDGVDL